MLLDYNPTSIKKAIELLKSGKLLCLPTDTQYAITCNACEEKAVLALLAAKERSPNRPLPVLVRDLAQAQMHAEFNDQALELVSKYWPGPLTMVLKQLPNSTLAPSVNSGFATLALRQCNSSIINDILAQVDFPIIGTSANITGEPTIKLVEEMQNVFGHQVSLIIRNQSPLTDTPSTILDLTTAEPRVIRRGLLRI